MITRRKFFANGAPALLATAGVCVNMGAQAEPTTDELLEWARTQSLHISVWPAGWTYLHRPRPFRAFGGKPTLREALLAAKAEIEKQAL